MKKTLIIINGAMGVGKTTISKALYKALNSSFWLDGDNCWRMNPFVVNEENKTMVLDNIAYILNSFLSNSSCEYIIFNWVIQTDDIMKSVLNKLDIDNVNIYKITLTCTDKELIKRIQSDIDSGKRMDRNIEASLERFRLYKDMDTTKIDTTGKSIEEVVDEIKNIIRI